MNLWKKQKPAHKFIDCQHGRNKHPYHLSHIKILNETLNAFKNFSQYNL